MNLWIDEVVSYLQSQGSVWYLFNSLDFHPPLYYLILKIWIFLFNDSVLSMKLLSVLISLFVIFYSVKLFKLFNNEKYRLKFFLINLILNASFVFHSTQIRQYILGLLFCVMGIYYYKLGKKYWFIFLTLGVYTHYFSIFGFIPVIYYELIRKRNYNCELRKKRNYTPFFFSFLLFYPYLIIFIKQVIYRLSSEDWFRNITFNSLVSGYVNYTGNLDTFKNNHLLQGILFIFGIICLILVLISMYQNRSDKQYRFLGIYLLIPVIVYLGCIIVKIYNPRYFFFLIIFYLIILFSLKSFKFVNVKSVFITITIFNLFLFISFFLNQETIFTEFSDYMIENEHSNIIITESPITMYPFIYYTRNYDFEHILIPFKSIEVYGGSVLREYERRINRRIVYNLTEFNLSEKSYYFDVEEHYFQGELLKSKKSINLLLVE